jgi:hypothetical protein
MMSNFTQETYDQALSDIKSGKVFQFGGRSAVTVEDLDFIAQVEGAAKPAAKTDEEKPKTGGGKKAAEKKAEETPKTPEVPPVVDDADAKKKEAEELVQAKLEALNGAKTDDEKAAATKEYEEAQKALLDLG